MNDINTSEAYNKFAKYYDAYVNGFSDDLDLYRSFCERNDKILEVGCGTGRVIKYLLEKGLTNITGIDISENMLSIARGKLDKYLKSKSLALKKHDLSATPLLEGFEKLFVTYYTFNYILQNPDKFLRNAYLSMAKNSFIIIDLFYPLLFLDPASDNIWLERKINLKGNKSITLRSKKTFDGTFERRTLVFVGKGDSKTVETSRRFYSREEIEELLHQAGFRNIKAIYGYSLGDTNKFAKDYPLRGYNKFNVDLDEYANREEVKSNFVVYAHKTL
ncbi:MAG: methyltransferase domain-containing protein [candidate division WOR-3 bacterium]